MGLFQVYKWQWGLWQLAHFKTIRHSCSSILVLTVAILPLSQETFQANILHQTHSICYRNCHRNTAFSAAWYVMLTGTRWRCNFKISSGTTKSCCSRRVIFETFSYIIIDPKWKLYHSLACQIWLIWHTLTFWSSVTEQIWPLKD